MKVNAPTGFAFIIAIVATLSFKVTGFAQRTHGARIQFESPKADPLPALLTADLSYVQSPSMFIFADPFIGDPKTADFVWGFHRGLIPPRNSAKQWTQAISQIIFHLPLRQLSAYQF